MVRNPTVLHLSGTFFLMDFKQEGTTDEPKQRSQRREQATSTDEANYCKEYSLSNLNREPECEVPVILLLISITMGVMLLLFIFLPFIT